MMPLPEQLRVRAVWIFLGPMPIICKGYPLSERLRKVEDFPPSA